VLEAWIAAEPLMEAARNGQVDVVKSILEKEAIEKPEPNAETLDGRSRALYLAAEGNHVVCMEELLKGGADVNYEASLNYKSKYTGNWMGRTPLMRAAFFGHYEAVTLLLDRGADINKAHRRSGYTPLMTAAGGGEAKVVKLLLERGANWSLTGRKGETALDGAATLQGLGDSGAMDVLEAWIAAEPLMEAVRNGQVKVVKSILGENPNPNPETLDGRSRALYLAAEGNHVACMEELLKAGADVNYEASVNYKGKQEIHTPLMRAAYFGHREVIKWLMEWYEQEAGTNDMGVPNDALKKAMDMWRRLKQSPGRREAAVELNAWTTLQRRKRRLFEENGENIGIEFVNNASFDIYIYKQDVTPDHRISGSGFVLTLKSNEHSTMWQLLPNNDVNDYFYIAVPEAWLQVPVLHRPPRALNSEDNLFVSAANVRKYGFEYGGGVPGNGPSQCMDEREKYFTQLASGQSPVVSGGL
jgi:ankyrin repeat protein